MRFCASLGESFNPYAINPNNGTAQRFHYAAVRADDPSGTYYGMSKTTDPGSKITADNVLEIYGQLYHLAALGPQLPLTTIKNLDEAL